MILSLFSLSVFHVFASSFLFFSLPTHCPTLPTFTPSLISTTSHSQPPTSSPLHLSFSFFFFLLFFSLSSPPPATAGIISLVRHVPTATITSSNLHLRHTHSRPLHTSCCLHSPFLGLTNEVFSLLDFCSCCLCYWALFGLFESPCI